MCIRDRLRDPPVANAIYSCPKQSHKENHREEMEAGQEAKVPHLALCGTNIATWPDGNITIICKVLP